MKVTTPHGAPPHSLWGPGWSTSPMLLPMTSEPSSRSRHALPDDEILMKITLGRSALHMSFGYCQIARTEVHWEVGSFENGRSRRFRRIKTSLRCLAMSAILATFASSVEGSPLLGGGAEPHSSSGTLFTPDAGNPDHIWAYHYVSWTESGQLPMEVPFAYYQYAGLYSIQHRSFIGWYYTIVQPFRPGGDAGIVAGSVQTGTPPTPFIDTGVGVHHWRTPPGTGEEMWPYAPSGWAAYAAPTRGNPEALVDVPVGQGPAQCPTF